MSLISELLDQLAEDPVATIDQAVEQFEKANLTPEEKSKLSYGLATACFKLDRHTEVKNWLKLTNDRRKHQLLAFNLLKENQFVQAAETFSKAAKIIPEEALECELLEAQSLALAGQLETSGEILERLIEQSTNPDFTSECRLNRGTVEMEKKNNQEARRWFDKIINDQTSDNFKSEAALHLLQIAQAEDKIETAIKYADWLKENGSEDFWREAGIDYLKRFERDKQKRRSKLRNYEY